MMALWDFEHSALDIAISGQRWICSSIPSIRLFEGGSEKVLRLCDAEHLKADRDEEALRLEAAFPGGPVVHFSIHRNETDLILSMAIENRTDRPIWLASASSIDGLLDILGNPREWILYRMGAGTFSPCGAILTSRVRAPPRGARHGPSSSRATCTAAAPAR